MLCASVLTACGGGADTGTGANTDVGTGGEGTGVTEKEEPELSGKTYDGETFRVLMSGVGASKLSDFGTENKNGYSRVASAIYLRNATVESLYKIKIEETEMFGTSTGAGPGYNEVTKDFAADDCNYDLLAIGTLDAAKLAIGGYLYDLNSLPYVDLECSWWDQNANDCLMIYDKMFYTTGDISVVDNIATHCILFNKSVATQYSVNDLYDSVKNDTWTYDKFLSYVKLVTDDVNGDQVMDHNDKYGLLTWNDVLQASLIGSGVRVAEIDENGEMKLTLYSEKTVDLISSLTDVFNDGRYVYNYTTRNMGSTQPSKTYDQERDAVFGENRCLFYGLTLNAVPRYRDHETLNFGILPYPKYNEQQEKYGSYVGASYSVMHCVEGIMPKDRVEFAGTVIESLAYESKKSVTPEYYEMTLKGRYLQDEESWDMLDIIFAERIFDVGMYYKLPESNPLTEQITAIIARRESGTFTSRYEATRTAALARIIELNTQWREFE